MLRVKRENLRVDFMTMHCYAWPNSDSFLRKVAALHEKYERPVWVTEYAVSDWRATKTRRSEYTRPQVEKFMRETVVGMRKMPFVERFAWKVRPIDDPQMGTSAMFQPGRLDDFNGQALRIALTAPGAGALNSRFQTVR